MSSSNQSITSTSIKRHTFAARPRNIEETGLSAEFISNLICKHIHTYGIQDLHQLSDQLALSGNIVKATLDALLQLRSAVTIAKQRGISLEKVFNG